MSRQALLIIDMQRGLFTIPRHDTDGLVSRINELSARMRAKRSLVIFVQHCGPEGDELHPLHHGHALHGDLITDPNDTIIKKSYCDAFLKTNLASTLLKSKIEEVVITGTATDFCVDTTIRSALANGYTTVVPEDGHTTADRPYMPTQKVIEHHNFVWAHLISPAGSVRLTRCDLIV